MKSSGLNSLKDLIKFSFLFLPIFTTALKLIPMNSWILQGILVWISILFVNYYIHTKFGKFARVLNKFPGPRTLPLIGGGLFVFLICNGIPTGLKNMIKQHGKTVRIWVAKDPYIFTTDVSIIEKILSSPKHLEKSMEYKNSRFFMGNGVVTSPPHIWRKDRKLLVPWLGRSMYDYFISRYNKHSKTLMKKLDEKFKSGKEIGDIRAELGRCAIDIITESISDVEYDYQNHEEFGLYEAMLDLADLIFRGIFQPWIKLPLIRTILGVHRIRKEAMELMHQAVPDHVILEEMSKWTSLAEMAQRGEVVEKPRKASQILCTAGKSKEELFHHVLSLTGAGSDTISISLNLICFLLATYPEVQRKAREEVDSILLDSDLDQERDLSQEDFKKLNYLELVIKESLRYIAPAPFLGRKVGAEILLENGLIIPKGTNVIIICSEVHRDPDYYPNHDKFIPERFLPENATGRSPFVYLPFSAGPRNCMGQHYAMMEMKVILSRILKRFIITTKKELKDIKMNYGIVIDPIGGLPLTLTRRNVN